MVVVISRDTLGFNCEANGPPTRYVKLRVAHAPWMPGTLLTSLTGGFVWNRWRGKRSRHSRRMRNTPFCVSGKRPMTLIHVQLLHNERFIYLPWWRHQMESFSALLALCAGNSPITGEFPSQRPVMRSLDVLFDLCLNKRLSEQSWVWWFETPLLPLRRHSNTQNSVNYYTNSSLSTKIKHHIQWYTFYFVFCKKEQYIHERAAHLKDLIRTCDLRYIIWRDTCSKSY